MPGLRGAQWLLFLGTCHVPAGYETARFMPRFPSVISEKELFLCPLMDGELRLKGAQGRPRGRLPVTGRATTNTAKSGSSYIRFLSLSPVDVIGRRLLVVGLPCAAGDGDLHPPKLHSLDVSSARSPVVTTKKHLLIFPIDPCVCV